MLLRDAQTKRKGPGLTDVLRLWAPPLRRPRHDPLGSAKREVGMELTIGDTAPDFEAETTEGKIHFHDWIGDSWAVLFSHPKDFTPVCTTELGYMAKIEPDSPPTGLSRVLTSEGAGEWRSPPPPPPRRNVKIIARSVDPLDRHSDWASD